MHLSGTRSARSSWPPGSSQFSPTAPGAPPADSPRWRHAAFGDERQRRVDEHLEVPFETLAAGRRARAAAAAPQPLPADPQRERPLERLDRSVARVRHPRVHAAHPRLRRRSATLPARDRLVVHPRVAAERGDRRSSTLFIVPCDAAPTRSGTASASARRHTSAMRWLTSTLPAPTAAGKRAATNVPSGAITETGRIVPALAGSVGSRRAPQGERHAGDGHRLHRVHVAGRLRIRPGEVEHQPTARGLDPAADHRRVLLIRSWTGGVHDVGGRPLTVAQRRPAPRAHRRSP